MKIVKHLRPDSEFGYTIQRVGGEHDGETFELVQVVFDNGQTKPGFWKSDSREGYFKQVFVPWDFEHEAIVKF